MDTRSFLLGVASADGGGGGGSDITVEALNVTANNTYTAPSGKAYSPVVVNVPNTYAAGDEGKVVSNGALVAQTAHATVTENGTVDTTLNNSVVVNVPTGGGGYTLLASEDFDVSTTSTSNTLVGNIQLNASVWSAAKILYVKIRDKAGARADHFLSNDSFLFNHIAAIDPTPALTRNTGTFSNAAMSVGATGTYQTVYNSSNGYFNRYGVFPYQLDSTGKLSIYSRYNATSVTGSGIIDGTYNVSVYTLDYAPDQGNPFNYSYPTT